jgi:hypothetical protein
MHYQTLRRFCRCCISSCRQLCPRRHTTNTSSFASWSWSSTTRRPAAHSSVHWPLQHQPRWLGGCRPVSFACLTSPDTPGPEILCRAVGVLDEPVMRGRCTLFTYLGRDVVIHQSTKSARPHFVSFPAIESSASRPLARWTMSQRSQREHAYRLSLIAQVVAQTTAPAARDDKGEGSCTVVHGHRVCYTSALRRLLPVFAVLSTRNY